MKTKMLAYWGVCAALIGTGLTLSIVERDGHYQFEWQGAELMAQPKLDEFHDIASLRIFNRVLLQLQQNYVDPSRLDPVPMMVSALDQLQKNVPELLFVFDRRIQEKPTEVTAKIAGQEKAFSLENIGNLWEMSLRLRTILAFIQPYLPQDANLRDLEYAAINGMLEVLDPHSVILSPEVYRSMVEGNRGKFGGLGIVIRMIDGVLVIVEKVEGDVPAKKAGLEEGDQILEIDGMPTLNMDINEAVDRLKGEPETQVNLLVRRKSWQTPQNVELTRAEIEISSLDAEALDGNIAYIHLKSFQGNTQNNLNAALNRMRKEMGSIAGLILDMRGNPGGLLEQAVSVADTFLENGTIVTTVGADESAQNVRKASPKATEPAYPIVVMLDSSSASASEIVAGALKNNDRALVVGDTSFGKGSVQVLYELPDKSSLKMTIGQYLTPGNLSIQSVGIVPDIRFIPMQVTSTNIDIYPEPWVRREESLGGHLDNTKALRDIVPAYHLRYFSSRLAFDMEKLDEDSVLTLEDIDRLIAEKEKTNQPMDDPQVRLAREILLQMGTTHQRPEMIEKFLTQADALQAKEDETLVGVFAKRDIDWKDCVQPDDLSIDVKLETDHDRNVVRAGDEFTIRATATNLGTQPVCRVSGRAVSSFKRLDDVELIFGRIEPGQSLTREKHIKTNRALRASDDDVVFSLYLDDDTPIPQTAVAQTTMAIQIDPIPQPSFQIHYAILDRDENDKAGNSLLDDDEEITLRVQIANDGTGTAEKPLIFLKNKAPEIRLLDARLETAPLAPGQSLTHDFKFKTTEVDAAPIQLELHIYDKSSTQMLVEKISFQTSKSPDALDKTLTPADGVVQVTAPTPLRVSPVPNANSLENLTPDETVSRIATFGDFTHIQAGALDGWVDSQHLNPSSNPPLSLTPRTIATIPRITPTVTTHRTSESTFTFEADIQGFAELLDSYAFVSAEVDHTFSYQKVAYQTIHGHEAHVRLEIPLAKGRNVIRFFTRDTHKSEAYIHYTIFRE